MGKRHRKARAAEVQATRSETPAIVKIGTGPALGEAMPASEAGYGYRGGRRRTSMPVRETHPWLEAERDAGRVKNCIAMAERGDTGPLQDLHTDLVKRDGRIRACAGARHHALASRKWLIKPPQGWEQDANAKQIAEQCSDVIAAIEEWPSVIERLSMGITRGLAVEEIMWATNRRGWWVPGSIQWRHANRFAWDGDLRICRREIGTAWPGAPLADLKPDGWIVHTPASGWMDYPNNAGLLVPCIPGAMHKRHGWKLWLKAAEKFGLPFAYMRVPSGVGENDDLETEAHRILRRMGPDGTVVIRGGADQIGFETVPGSGEVTGELQRSMVEVANVEHAIILLGQNLTTEVQGGSYAAATVHNYVRGDLLAGDAMEMGVTIRRFVLEPLCRLNGWTMAPHPVYETQLSHQQEIKSEDVAAGHFTPDEYRGWKGYAPKPEGAGASFQVPAQITPQPIGGGAPAPSPFGQPPPMRATNGQTIPRGTLPISSRGGRTNPS